MSSDRESRADSLDGLLRAASALLAAAGLEHPRAEAELLVLRCLGLPRSALLARPDALVAGADAARVRDWARRHAAGEPLAYLEGSVGFRRLELAVDRRVLVPRADSEVVVEAALDALRGVAAPRVLDLGTGSGCLLLALLDEHPGASGVGVDLSEDALAVARANAAASGLAARAEFRQGDFLAAAAGPADAAAAGHADGAARPDWMPAQVDLLISNPPYVVRGEELGPGVAEYEPALALFVADDDPLSPYDAILRLARRACAGAQVVLEVGAGRAAAVAERGAALGFTHLESRRDLGGIARAVVLGP